MRGSLPLLAGVVLAGGCRSILGIDEASVGADASVTPDVAIDAAPGCYGAEPFMICLTTPPDTSLNFSQAREIDTDTSACPLVYPHGLSSWCVYPAVAVNISAPIHAHGSRPLVLVATERLTITATGAVDVSSRLSTLAATALGAGARLGPCTDGSPGVAMFNGGGGGAGGSFGTRGGTGAPGDLGLVPGGQAGLPASGIPQDLRGGCVGAIGGLFGGANGSVGEGGGAVYLLAGTQLDVAGRINASGAAAGGGQPSSGGGSGAGSGGMIVLWSPEISLMPNAQIFANGGGGGGGGNAGAAGEDGRESANATIAGAGGSSAGAGSSTGGGGNGSLGPGAGLPGGMGARDEGGGGGGGGAGVIRVISKQTLTGGNLSPPPSP